MFHESPYLPEGTAARGEPTSPSDLAIICRDALAATLYGLLAMTLVGALAGIV
jgi:hypothetical protein